MYLKSAEGTILAFLMFCRITNLCFFSGAVGFESRPAQLNSCFTHSFEFHEFVLWREEQLNPVPGGGPPVLVKSSGFARSSVTVLAVLGLTHLKFPQAFALWAIH